MSNLLKVSLQTTIYSLADRGGSQRRIASELGINRETVGRYLRLTKPANSFIGSEEEIENQPIAGVGAGRRSQCELLLEIISAKVEVGLSARRIYQDLVEQNDFGDSYQSVQRFVRKLKATQLQRIWRLEARPVIPITMNKDWNLITRTICPITQLSPSPEIQSAFGLGDINPTVFLSPKNSGKLLWGVGPTMTFPTATNHCSATASGAPDSPWSY